VDALERIRKQVELVEELLGELETEKSYRGIERLVQLIIQALLDLGLMVVAALGLRRPRAYSEVGYILWEQGVLSRHDAEMLRSMAGLRNVLVHAYARVDRGRIFEFAERLKVDARRVASAVLKGVEGKPIDPPEDSVAGMVEKLKRALSGKVVLALLYGGRAKGYALKGDYDVAVLMEQGCDLYKLGELVVDVAEALGVPEELVDVVCIDALPPEHALEALSGVPVIVGDPALLLDLKLKALQQLLDLEEGLRSCGVAPRSPPLRAPEDRVEERRVG
jgi:uncharacterized protein YutE (UPF0331/DUF86 family)/predicted nucleotidyltransferase